MKCVSNHSGVPQGIDTLLGIAKLPEELFRILSKLGSRFGWSRFSRFDRGIKGSVVSIIFQGDGLNSSFITDKRIFKGCLKIMDRSMIFRQPLKIRLSVMKEEFSPSPWKIMETTEPLIPLSNLENRLQPNLLPSLDRIRNNSSGSLAIPKSVSMPCGTPEWFETHFKVYDIKI